jgi:hypothetical protein
VSLDPSQMSTMLGLLSAIVIHNAVSLSYLQEC